MKYKKRKIPHQRGAQAWIKRKNSKGISNKELEHSVGIFSNRTKKSVMKEKKLTEKQYYKRRSFLATVYGLLTGSIKWKNYNNSKNKKKINVNKLEKDCKLLLLKSWEYNDENLKYKQSDKRCFDTIVERDVCEKVANLQWKEKRYLSKSEISKIRKERIKSLAEYNADKVNYFDSDRYIPKEYKYLLK